MTTEISLPKVLRVLYREDAGEYGATVCPHCGAEGRYTIYFEVEDGSTLGAMSGCFKLFPKSEYADRYAEALTKIQAAEKKGWKPNSWAVDIIEGIDKYIAGEITKEQLDNGLRAIAFEKKSYMKRRGYIR